MITQNRMSPMTALFLGIFGVGAVGIASGTSVVLYAMHVIDRNVSEAIGLVDGTLTDLPAFIDSLPDSIGELLHSRRAPEYAAQIDVSVDFVADSRSDTVRPVLTIVNNGDEVVSLLAIRVAALKDKVPARDWTEVVATPLAIDHDWPGPLMPGSTRHIVLSRCNRNITADDIKDITGSWEIADVRVWSPEEAM